jgi:hypothetical protein
MKTPVGVVERTGWPRQLEGNPYQLFFRLTMVSIQVRCLFNAGAAGTGFSTASRMSQNSGQTA